MYVSENNTNALLVWGTKGSDLNNFDEIFRILYRDLSRPTLRPIFGTKSPANVNKISRFGTKHFPFHIISWYNVLIYITYN